MPYEAVFLDAGLTILGPHPSFHELFADTLNNLGHSIHPSEVEQAFAQEAPTFVEVLDRTESDTWTTSMEASRKFWGAVYGVAFDTLGIDDSKGDLKEALYERFTRFDSYRLYPDTLPTLQALKERGIVTGLISNFEEWLAEMLAHMEIASFFDVTVISGVEGIEKPHPDIFRLALERAGVSPEASLYVGDHVKIDVEGSEAVGMRGVLIDRDGKYPDFPGRRIESLAEILEVDRFD